MADETPRPPASDDVAPPEPAVERPPPADGTAEPEAVAGEGAVDAPPESAAPPGREGPRQPRPRPERQRRRERPRRNRGGGASRPPQRSSGPLPFQELRDAAAAVIDQFGARQALRDAFSALGDKERRDLSRLVAEDGDWRVRARNIAAGSLGAGRVGKALAAQQISMARVEDLWPLTLSKEEAAERQARVRNARRRDERRARRDAEREQRSDRVSRADLEKAQDGRVGAQVRIVIAGQPRDKRGKGEDERKPEPDEGSSVLDRLGY